jgi:hypothetical protein
VAFHPSARASEGAFFDGGAARLKTAGLDEVLFDRAYVRLPGDHLASDMLAAATAARLMGAPVEAIRRAVRAYTGVEHVLERVEEIAGVAFFNDSKATNVEAARKSLEAFPGVVLPILGGRYKGGGLRGPRPRVCARTARRCWPSAKPHRASWRRLAAVIPVVPCDSLREAVERGFALATAGDTVLLAPACSSFDMFEDYAARGPRLQGRSARRRWRRSAVAKKISSDSSLFAVTVALLGLGLVMVWSASSGLAQERYGNAYYFLIRQVVWACVGLVCMVAAMRTDYRKLRHPAVVYSAVLATLVLLIAVLSCPPSTTRTAGSGWDPFRCSRRRSRSSRPSSSSPTTSSAAARTSTTSCPRSSPCCCCWAGSPSSSSSSPTWAARPPVILIGCVMLFLAGVRLRYFAALTVLGLPVVYQAIMMAAYRRDRIEAYLNPWSDARGSGLPDHPEPHRRGHGRPQRRRAHGRPAEALLPALPVQRLHLCRDRRRARHARRLAVVLGSSSCSGAACARPGRPRSLRHLPGRGPDLVHRAPGD